MRRTLRRLSPRLMRCSCNHPLRYGTRVCSYCFQPTPLANRLGTLAAVVAAGAVLYYMGR